MAHPLAGVRIFSVWVGAMKSSKFSCMLTFLSLLALTKVSSAIKRLC